MSKEVKWAGMGAILSPLLIAFLVGVTGLFGTWASKVPALETTVTNEFHHVKEKMDTLTDAQIDTNKNLKEYTKAQTLMTHEMSQTVMINSYKILSIEKALQDKGH